MNPAQINYNTTPITKPNNHFIRFAKVLIAGFVVTLVVFTIIFSSIFNYITNLNSQTPSVKKNINYLDNTNIYPSTTATEPSTDSNFKSITGNKQNLNTSHSLPAYSTYNEPPSLVYRPELDFLEKVLIAIKNGKNIGWKEDSTSNDVSINDIGLSNLDSWKNQFEKDLNLLTIPDYLKSVYKDDKAQQEFKVILFKARKEYIDLLKIYNVNPQVISEIENHVFTEDEDHLWVSFTSDIYKEYPFVDSVESKKYPNRKDVYEAYMRFEMGAAYAYSYRIHQSGLLGKEPQVLSEKIEYWRKVRELGTRVIFFHEMTHVLQIAYRNLVVLKIGETAAAKLSNLEVGAEKYFPKRYFWDITKSPFSEHDNFVIANEGMAALMQQKMASDLFKMDSQQAKVLWDYTGGGERVKLVRNQLTKIKELTTGDSDYIDKIAYINEKLPSRFNNTGNREYDEFLEKIIPYTSTNVLSSYAGYSVDFNEEELNSILVPLSNAP